MHIKFRITLEDGSTIESHDEMWNEVRTHAHALFPHNEKRWVKYELVSDESHVLGVNLKTGIFNFNGTNILPFWDGLPFERKDNSNDFSPTKEWSFLSSLPYFPIVGRRVYAGDRFSLTVFICGWKAQIAGRTIEVKYCMYSDGRIGMVD